MEARFVSRANVWAAIDHTANVEGAIVGVQYVNKKGQLRNMLIRKSRSEAKTDRRKTSTTSYMVRDRGLIRIIDMKQNQPKSLFIFSIIGFDPHGTSNTYYRVKHEHSVS